MIKTILFIITFLTSSICFIDLIRNKKQYRNIAYVIVIVLTFTFVRIILIWNYEYHYYIRICALMFQITLFGDYIIFGSTSEFRNYEKLYEEKKANPKILFFALLVLNVVDVLWFHDPFASYDVRINNQYFKTINIQFVKKLESMITDKSLYLFLKQNLFILSIYIHFIVTIGLIYVSSSNAFKFLRSKGEERYIKRALLLSILSFFMSRFFSYYQLVVQKLLNEFGLSIFNI